MSLESLISANIRVVFYNALKTRFIYSTHIAETIKSLFQKLKTGWLVLNINRTSDIFVYKLAKVTAAVAVSKKKMITSNKLLNRTFFFVASLFYFCRVEQQNIQHIIDNIINYY